MKIIRASLASALGFLMAAVLLACQQQPPAPTAGTKSVAPATGAPAAPATQAPAAPTGVLRIGLPTLGREGIAPLHASGQSAFLTDLMYDALVGLNTDATDLGSIGGLATEWQQSPDGASWTFKLRKGVQFTQGYGELTAADVKAHLDLVVFSNLGDIRYRTDYQRGIKEIVVVDPYTVRIDLKQPYISLPLDFSRMNGFPDSYIAPKKAYDETGPDAYAKNPKGGSGPYQLVEQKLGSYVKYEANDKYWGGMPRYKEVYVYLVPEEATRVAMLKRGELDMAELGVVQLKALRQEGFKTVEKDGALSFSAVTHNTWEGALAKKEVRLALQLAIDRKTISEKLYEGAAKPLGSFPTWIPGAKDLPPYPYDPGRAKELLAQAGYPNGFDMTVITAHPDASLLNEALTGYFKAVGINATIKIMELNTWVDQWSKGTLPNTIAPYPRPNDITVLTHAKGQFLSSAPRSVVRNTDPVLDELIKNVDKARTPNELRELSVRIQEHWYNQSYYIYVVQVGQWFAAQPKVDVTGWNVGGKAIRGYGWRQLLLNK